MKSGEPPTALNARTGELTPPGSRSSASAKSRSERLARHAGAPVNARATDSAARSPDAMQSGMPTPRYAAPASGEPGMLDEALLDPRETFRMAEDVLRHARAASGARG